MVSQSVLDKVQRGEGGDEKTSLSETEGLV